MSVVRKELADLRGADCWIFDLDNTLYPIVNNLFPQVEVRMTQFICERLGLDFGAAVVKQKLYFQEHGTTLKGLMDFDGVDAYEFLDFVHDIDYSFLSVDSALDDILDRLPGRKGIFTNGSVSHAQNVLEALGVSSRFDFIFDIAAANFVPKPHFSGYDILFQQEGIICDRAVMVEDIAKNLKYPHSCGVATVWIENDLDSQPNHRDSDYVDFPITDLVQFLRSVLD